jgi:uncharacterized membrane-anchored protein
MQWRSYFDSLIQNLKPATVTVLNWIVTISATITLIEFLDITLRVITGVITIGVGLLSWRHYMLKNRNLEKDIQLKDQELYARTQENKKKYG